MTTPKYDSVFNSGRRARVSAIDILGTKHVLYVSSKKDLAEWLQHYASDGWIPTVGGWLRIKHMVSFK